MQGRGRRYWTWLVTAGAGLVLAAAVASGLFQLAVQAVPGYRGDIERYVREVTGQGVRIGGLALTWRYYYPRLDLVDVALLSADGQRALLGAERLRLGFALTRLLRGDFMPNRLELHGVTLDLQRDANGRLQVAGMDELGDGSDEPTSALRTLAGFAELRLERCRLNLRDAARPRDTLSLGITYASWERGLLGTELEAELTLPAAFGDSAYLEASLDGEPLEPSTWQGDWRAELSGLSAGDWLAPYLARGAKVELAGAEARLGGELEHGELTALRVELQADAVRGRRAQHQFGIEALDARVDIEFSPEGWIAKLVRLELEGRDGPWPDGGGELQYSTAGGEPAWTAEAEFLRLGDLAPWLQIVRAPGRLAELHDAAGEVEDLHVRWQGRDADARYSVRASVEGLSLPASGRPAGVSGASGELAADETGGRMVLSERALELELPGVLLTPRVPIESFAGELEWARLRDGWRMALPQFRWKLLTTRGTGRFQLVLPDDPARSPEIDLHAAFSAEDATQAKPLMPNAWGRGLIDYLDRAVIAARAPSAELTITGPLEDFPFDQKPGTFALDIQAEDVQFAFQPDWPAVENVAATLKFRGNSLSIESRQGSLGGVAIKQVTARFADFARPDLLIDGSVHGAAPDMYDVLSRSPLRETLSALLRRTTATGEADVNVHLFIPVAHAQDTRVMGDIVLDGLQLKHRSLPEPIREIRGGLKFSGRGVSAESISAKLYGLPVDVRIAARGDVSELKAAFRAPLDPQGAGISSLIPADIRRHLSGTSDWRAQLQFGGREESPLTLTSDLVGVQVQLPPPLGKPAAERVPLTLKLGESAAAPLLLQLEYQDRFGANLALQQEREGWGLSAGGLRFGAGAAPELPESGLELVGTVPELDVKAWAEQLEGTGVVDSVGSIRRARLQIGRAVWGNYALRDLRCDGQPLGGDGWQVNLVGAGASGMARWKGSGRGGTLHARLDRLALEVAAATPEPAGGTAPKPGPPLDPAELPRLDLDVASLAIGNTEFGRMRLDTARVPEGQRIRELKFSGAGLEGTVQGEWLRRNGRSIAATTFDLTSGDAAGVLRAVGYTANLDAKRARVQGRLNWPATASGVEWQMARGVVTLEFQNGQLRAVEPGAGRVLGLLNFYALPRRLSLNFRDIWSKGLGFDEIKGDFQLADGNAHSDNLVIDGPSLRMEVKGRIGLAARDYDQYVSVYPDVSAGVTLGAALLGGPLVGGLVLIAQQILDKPLESVTQMSYRVTGSWDNPQVERGVQAPTEAARKPGPPSQTP